MKKTTINLSDYKARELHEDLKLTYRISALHCVIHQTCKQEPRARKKLMTKQ